MPEGNYKRPGVSFNMDDPYEAELYEFAKSRKMGFSKYVKFLIELDRRGLIGGPGAKGPAPEPDTANKKEEPKMDFSVDDMGAVFG